jgi:hypothetical protein
MKLVESKNNSEINELRMNGSKIYSRPVQLDPEQILPEEKFSYNKKSLFNITITLTERGQNIINVLDQFICREFSITREELKSEDRYMPLPKARGAFTSILRSNFGFPLKVIGMHLGGRDHSSILMAERRAKEFYKKNATFRSHYDSVEKYFKELLSGNESVSENNKTIAG